MVIETFNLAKSLIEKERTLKGNVNAGCIIYIDELDAIGAVALTQVAMIAIPLGLCSHY